MIQSFKDQDARRIWEGGNSTRLPADIQRAALRKLAMLNAAHKPTDLLSLRGNNLEAMKGKARRGQYSIRINDQWRICFRWEGADAVDVEIVDYH